MNLFHSARLKLTAFYFAVLVIFCLLLTFGVRTFTGYELRKSDQARSGAVHRIFERLYYPEIDNDTGQTPPPPSGQYFATTEQRQSDVTRQRLNRDFLILDLGVLAVGAVLSYWYAGRTLRPIEQAHEEQKRFTADASHELRTPLASMRLENEVFLRQKNFSEKDARDLIGSNLEEVARLERLATNLLSLHQYEAGALVRYPVAISKIVKDAVEHTKRTSDVGKRAFETKIQPATVLADKESITQLLSILLDNAVKYGAKDGSIEITGVRDDSGYSLAVRDHGPGISEEDLPHIFERMYRGDKARSSKVAGHGIGLSLAQQIAEANEAELSAANHPSGGAIFTLILH